jgi:hypothetical protein
MDRMKRRFRSSLVCKLLFFSVVLLSVMFTSFPLNQAQAATLTIQDINYQAMTFGTPTRISGTDKQQGAVYKYTDVITGVDAKITVQEVSANATLDTVDSGASNTERFNPYVHNSSSTNEAYVNFKVDFFDKSGSSIQLKNFKVTIVDLDGESSSVKEFAEVSGFKEYIVNNPTGLTIGNGANGRTRFSGLSTSVDGIPFQDNDSFIAPR